MLWVFLVITTLITHARKFKNMREIINASVSLFKENIDC
jgi:hypothetical protein